MKKQTLTCKRKTELLKDEAKASKEYLGYGWLIGNQESAHRKFIKKQPCKRRRRRK